MRDVLRATGALSPFISSCVARLPMGALGLLLVLHTQQITGSYVRGGLASGAYAIALGLSNPLLARVVDRRGQTLVLRAGAPLAAATIVALALLPDGAPLGAILAAAACAGMFQPPVGRACGPSGPSCSTAPTAATPRTRSRAPCWRSSTSAARSRSSRYRIVVDNGRAHRLRDLPVRRRPRLLVAPALPRVAAASRARPRPDRRTPFRKFHCKVSRGRASAPLQAHEAPKTNRSRS